MDLEYRVEDYWQEVDLEDYMLNYRDEDYFLSLCKECGNYGNRWGCPPFQFSISEFLVEYRKIKLWAKKIYHVAEDLHISAAHALLRPERKKMESKLLSMERECGGRSFGFAGGCDLCGEVPCSRLNGQPCRNPECVRPSLEAFGFNIGKTLSDLFGLEILWSSDGKMPEYLILVSGIMF